MPKIRFAQTLLFSLALVMCLAPQLFPLTPARAENGDAHGTDAPAEKKPKSIQDKIDMIRTRLDAADQAIMTANKQKDCDGDGQCEVVEAGARICGGPTTLIVVSAANPRISQVKAKILEYTAVQKEMNLVDPPTTCPPVPAPIRAACEKNQCLGVSQK